MIMKMVNFFPIVTVCILKFFIQALFELQNVSQENNIFVCISNVPLSVKVKLNTYSFNVHLRAHINLIAK